MNDDQFQTIVQAWIHGEKMDKYMLEMIAELDYLRQKAKHYEILISTLDRLQSKFLFTEVTA